MVLTIFKITKLLSPIKNGKTTAPKMEGSNLWQKIQSPPVEIPNTLSKAMQGRSKADLCRERIPELRCHDGAGPVPGAHGLSMLQPALPSGKGPSLQISR